MKFDEHGSEALVVQLFNGTYKAETVLDDDSAPSNLRAESEMRAAGLRRETIPAFGFPWNPAAKMHNAYLGLDPLRALRVLLTRRKAALVCAHMESAVILLLLRRLFLFRPPIIIWEVPWSPGWRYREIVSRLALPRADRSVVFGSNQIPLLRAKFEKSIEATFVPFCIDSDFYRPLPSSASSKPYIFSCGLDIGRDFDVLIKATESIDCDVVIKAGRNISIDTGSRQRIRVITEILPYTQYRNLYANATLVVVTTKQTTNASGVTALLEAMAMGKPVVVSNNPALQDYLPPPEAGIIVPISDASALQAAIASLLANPIKAAQMGNNGREFVLQRFSPKAHVRATARLFWDVIKATGGRDRSNSRQ